MLKKYISLSAAKASIFVVFVIALVACMLFTWSAHVLTAGAVDPTVQIPKYDTGLMLRQIDLLQTQIDGLQGELDTARVQLNNATVENQQLVDAQVERIQEMTGDLSFEYAGTYYATAYCCEVYPHICGGNGVTASGTVPTPGITVAADWGVFPAGTWLYIDGIGVRRVEDKGSAIQGNKLDIALATHAEALRWGNGNYEVWILNWSMLE